MDPAFGSGTGRVITNVGGDDAPADMFVQSTGEPVVVGTSKLTAAASNFAVVRYTAAGVLDTTFGGGTGRVIVDFAGGTDVANAVAPTTSVPPKIVVAGSASGADFGVIRLTSAGVLDTTFSSDGRATVSLSASTDVANSVRVVAGNGKVVTDIGGGLIDQGNDVLAQSIARVDGPIIVFARTSGGGAVLRYLPNGALDTNWSNDGKFTTAAVPVAEAIASQIRAEGDVLGALTATGHVSDTNGDRNPANDTDAETITVLNTDGCTIIGTSGPDNLIGTGGADVMCGLAGDDTMSSGGGNDTLVGGTGDDTLTGGNGDDTLTGDPIASDAGSDDLLGGKGQDTLQATDGVSGNDIANGGTGTDSCTADAGDTVRQCP